MDRMEMQTEDDRGHSDLYDSDDGHSSDSSIDLDDIVEG